MTRESRLVTLAKKYFKIEVYDDIPNFGVFDNLPFVIDELTTLEQSIDAARERKDHKAIPTLITTLQKRVEFLDNWLGGGPAYQRDATPKDALDIADIAAVIWANKERRDTNLNCYNIYCIAGRYAEAKKEGIDKESYSRAWFFYIKEVDSGKFSNISFSDYISVIINLPMAEAKLGWSRAESFRKLEDSIRDGEFNKFSATIKEAHDVNTPAAIQHRQYLSMCTELGIDPKVLVKGYTSSDAVRGLKRIEGYRILHALAGDNCKEAIIKFLTENTNLEEDNRFGKIVTAIRKNYTPGMEMKIVLQKSSEFGFESSISQFMSVYSRLAEEAQKQSEHSADYVNSAARVMHYTTGSETIDTIATLAKYDGTREALTQYWNSLEARNRPLEDPSFYKAIDAVCTKGYKLNLEQIRRLEKLNYRAMLPETIVLMLQHDSVN